MPLGAFRLNSLARYAAEAPVEQRTAVTVTANGDAQVDTAQSKFGGASALFDGTGDRLETPNTGIKLGTETTTWTVEGWLRVSTLPSSFKGFLSNQDGAITGGGGSNNGWGAYINSSNQIQFIQYVGAPVRKTTTAITANTWNHFAFVRDGTSFKIYLNGTEEYTTTSYASSTDVDDNIFIGTSFNISNGYNGLLDFNGYIDEVRISNTARYTSNFTPSTSAFTNDADTLLLLHMDGTDGSTTFIDDNGTGRSAVGVSALGNAQVDTAQSKFGGASALFDGTGDYLELGDVSITQDEDLTIEGWVRFNALPSIYAMFVGGAGTSEYVGLRNFSGTWALNAAYNDSSVGTYYHNYELGSTPTTGVWYHWAVVKSGSTIKHFWNGTELTTDYNSAGTMTSGHGWSNVSRIGTWTGSGYEVNGHLDEFRMSNTARYTTSFTAPTEPFENDNNTLLLLHMDRYDADTTVFLDDNGKTLPTYTPPPPATYETALSLQGGDYGYLPALNTNTTHSMSFFCWFKWDGVNTNEFIMESFRNGKHAYRVEVYQGINADSRTSSNSKIVQWFPSEYTISSNTWYALFFSMNPANNGQRYLAIQQLGSSTVQAQTPDTNGTGSYDSAFYNQSRDIGIGARGANGAVTFRGAIAEWWQDDSFVDFSNATTRQKFVTSSGQPVDLGADGSTPLGTTPVYYLAGDTINSTNRGTGSNPTYIGSPGTTSGPGA